MLRRAEKIENAWVRGIESSGDKVAKRHAPWFTNGCITARHGDIVKMGKAFEFVEAADQHLPAPDASVGSIAGSVEREADHRTRKRVLSHAARDVRMMMLHADQAQAALAGPLFSPACGEIAGVQIVHNGLRFNFKCVHQVAQGLLKEPQTCRVFKIADVLALIGEPAAGQREHVLQMASNGEQRRGFERQRHSEWNKTPGATDDLRLAIDKRNDGIVAALQDLAVVHEECVSDSNEAGAGFVVVDGDGLFAEIRRGHHQGLHARIGKEQILQRRIRQEDTQPRNAVRDRECNSVVIARVRQHDGVRGRLQQGLFRGSQFAENACCREIAGHDGERLAIAMFALAKTRDCILTGCVHAQVESADAFDRHDFVAKEPLDRVCNRVRGINR